MGPTEALLPEVQLRSRRLAEAVGERREAVPHDTAGGEGRETVPYCTRETAGLRGQHVHSKIFKAAEI